MHANSQEVKPSSNVGPRRFLPHLIVLGIFLLVAAIFCMPWLQGDRLLPHDVESWLKMSKETRDFKDATGETSYWMNNVFGGMPSALTDPYYDNNWFSKIKNTLILYTHGENMNPIMLFFWAMLGGYLLALSFKVKPWLAGIAGLAFAFSTYNPIIIAAGHTTKFLDIAYVPGILAGIVMAYRGKYWLGAAIAGVYTAFAIDAGHYQIIYYSLFAILALVISELVIAVKRGTIKNFAMASALLLLAGGLAAGTSTTRLLLTQEVTQFTMRGTEKELNTQTEDKGLDKDYAFKWSNGIGETMALVVPNLYGGGHLLKVNENSNKAQDLMQTFRLQPQQLSGLAYWGPQQEDGLGGSIYFGAIVIFLAIFAVLIIRSPRKWWLIVASVFFIMLSWGKNLPALNYTLFDYLPLMNKFRSPNMAMALASMLVPVLALWGLNELLTGKVTKEQAFQKFKTSIIATSVVFVVLFIAVYFMMDYTGAMDPRMFGEAWTQVSGKVIDFRRSLATSDLWRSLFFVLLAAGVLFAFIKEKMTAKVATIAIAVLVALDILPVAARYLGEDKYRTQSEYDMAFAARPVDREILKDTSYYRVLDLSRDLFNSADASYHHKTIGGYHPSKLQIYQDLIQRQLGNLNSAVINMLNGKYIINPDRSGKPVVFPNTAALGNAWFVEKVKTVSTAEEEITALNAPPLSAPNDSTKGDFDPAKTVIVRETELEKLGNTTALTLDEQASIRLTSYSPMKLTYESNNNAEGIAVFSEIYYPLDWEAKIDGQTVPIARVNYVLRAIKIPAGRHQIEMVYNTPKSVQTGDGIALASSIGLILLAGAGLFFHFRRKKD